jgi:uncharacterized membrane protein YcaP (DUF421 family)
MNDLFHNTYVQIVLRCIAVYFFIIIAIRVFGKKELAQLSVIDLVFILLISNSVQNAMVDKDNAALPIGLIAALTLFSINFLLKQLLYRNKKANELLQGKALILIYKGELNTESLKESEITYEELSAAVREHGVEDIKHVDLAVLEVDGNISVISDDFKSRSSHPVAAIGSRRKHKMKGRLGQS